MELRADILNDKPIETLGRVTKMTLDDESTSMIFQLFTGGLYSDPIGSMIREVTSNCFDSHVEAKVDSYKNPVVVEIKDEMTGKFITFHDKGVGMCPDRVENILGRYFKSTKRKSNRLIGGYGLGAKTPLAYTESFFVETVSEKQNDIDFCKNNIVFLEKLIEEIEKQINEKLQIIESHINNTIINTKKFDEIVEMDNDDVISNLSSIELSADEIITNIEVIDESYEEIEKIRLEIKDFEARLYKVSNIKEPRIKYIYNIFEGNNEPLITNLSLNGTNDINQTTVKVPIKDKDIEEINEKTLRQLYYFENIVFKGFNENVVSNDYQIFKGDNFVYRGNDYSEYIHVCYGKVAYPIDYDALGLDSHDYKIPIAIKIDIGELEGTGVTPSREALKYSSKNCEIIKKKIEETINELKERLSKQYENTVTLFDYYKIKEKFGNLFFDDNHFIYIGKLMKINEFTFPNFKYSNINIPSFTLMIELFYDIKLYGKKYPKWGNTGNTIWKGHLFNMNKYSNIYYCDSHEFNRKIIKQAYLKSINDSENFHIIKPKRFDDKFFDSIIQNLSYTGQSDQTNLYLDNIIPKNELTSFILELFNDLHEIVKHKSTGNYDNVIVPDDFINRRKRKKISGDLLKTTIPLKDNYSTGRISIEKLLKFNGKIYYGFKDDWDEIWYSREIFDSISSRKYSTSVSDVKYDITRAGTMFVVISKQNEKYIKLLSKKAIHVKYFYQTYVARKIDFIIKSIEMKKYNQDYCKINNIFFDERIMPHIDKNIYDLAKKIQNYFHNNEKFKISGYISAEKIKSKLNIDINSFLNKTCEYNKELNQLIDLSKKNYKRLKWFSIPSHIDITKSDHKELVDMLQLVFEQ